MLALVSRIGFGKLFALGVGARPFLYRHHCAAGAIHYALAARWPNFPASSLPRRDCAVPPFSFRAPKPRQLFPRCWFSPLPGPGSSSALRTFRCPVILVAVLGMTYRYIFVVLQTAFEMFEARQEPDRGRDAAA